MTRAFEAALVVVALSSSACLECCDPAACPQQDAGPGAAWQTAFDTAEAGSVSSVWGSGSDDVWAVGGGARGTIFHFDGTAWSKQAAPDVPLLIWVYGFATDDVYAVGMGGSALHYDGASWSAIDTGTSDDLWGVFGFTSDDVWLVGGDAFEGPPLLLHYDGAVVTPYTLPDDENPVGALAVFKIWGIGQKIFAVGQSGLILEYSGGEWLFRDAGALADDDFISLWGTSESHMVAVGGRANGRIAIYDGASWSAVDPESGGLNGVFVPAPGVAIVGGVEGQLGSYRVDDGVLTLDDVDTRFDIHAVWGDGEGTTYAVGGTFLAPFRGVALKRIDP